MKTFADNIKPILGLTIVIMTYTIFIICLFRFSHDINVVSQIIIAVVGGFGVATGYYFGYSQGAAKQAENQQHKPLATTNTGDVIVDSKGGVDEK